MKFKKRLYFKHLISDTCILSVNGHTCFYSEIGIALLSVSSPEMPSQNEMLNILYILQCSNASISEAIIRTFSQKFFIVLNASKYSFSSFCTVEYVSYARISAISTFHFLFSISIYLPFSIYYFQTGKFENYKAVERQD